MTDASTVLCKTWYTAYILGDVVQGVKDGIHGVDLFKLHECAVAELARLVKLASAQAGLKDVERRHPHAEGHGCTSLCQALGNGPAKALVISNAGNKRLFTCTYVWSNIG